MIRRFFKIVALLLAIVIICRVWPHASLREQLSESRLVFASDGYLLRFTLADDGQYRLWANLSDISPKLVEAVQLKEDQQFYYHFGINPVSLMRAFWVTYVGKHRQGGSTITMQLARQWYHINTHSVRGKIKQMALAVWLELRYSKHDILEAYLNIVPMGGNIQGVDTASRLYFKKTAATLSLPECLTLAVLPQNPTKRANFGSALQKAYGQLADLWQAQHPEDEKDLRRSALPIPTSFRDDTPFLTPHLTDRLLLGFPEKIILHSTVDMKTQLVLERVLHKYISQNQNKGIQNAAALLIDSRDQTVKALIGSADYFNKDISGQVNAILAKRSPGSTLKPFLYGLAFDQGIIHPLSILKDAPTAFGPFQPENFDGRFVGPLHARDALVRSRNIPAVSLATQVKNPSLYGFLKNAGVSQLLSESHYGLALALGGGELTMEELASLYTMLANDGVLRPIRYLQDEPESEGTKLLSPEAAFLVVDALKDNPRPDTITQNERSSRHWTVAWKTGTSWGFRDAWTAGLVGPYVLVVWVGNFDGHGNPAFVGLNAAAPLFFRMVDALSIAQPNVPDRPMIPPKELTRVTVCAASGDLPNKWCPQTTETWFIAGKSPIRVSTLHRPVVVNKYTGEPVCPPYDSAMVRTDVMEFWPSDMLNLFRQAGIPRRVPPALSCQKSASSDANAGDSLNIKSPLSQVTYTLRISKPEETIALQASSQSDAKNIFWFANKRFLGRASAEKGLAWRPDQSGEYAVTVVDDYGRSATRILQVEFVP